MGHTPAPRDKSAPFRHPGIHAGPPSTPVVAQTPQSQEPAPNIVTEPALTAGPPISPRARGISDFISQIGSVLELAGTAARPELQENVFRRQQTLKRQSQVDEGLQAVMGAQLKGLQDPEGALRDLEMLADQDDLPAEAGAHLLEVAQGLQNRAAMATFLRNRVATVDDPGAQAALDVLQAGGTADLAGQALDIASRGRFNVTVSPELGMVFVEDPTTGSVQAKPIDGLPTGVTGVGKPTAEQNAMSIAISGLPILDLMKAARTDPLRRMQLAQVFAKNNKISNDHDRWAITLYGPQGTKKKLGVTGFADLANSFPVQATTVIDRVNAEEAKVRGAGALAAEEAKIRARKQERPGPQEFWVDLKGPKESLRTGKSMPPTKRLLNRRGELEAMADREEATIMDRAGFESLRGFDAADSVILTEIERTANMLPDTSFQAVLNRVVFPVQRFAGIPGVGQRTGAGQAFNLVIGRILQGSARLSDLDFRAAQFINITDGDTRASARIKIDIFRRLSKNMRAAFMGIDTRANAVFKNREAVDRLEAQIRSAQQASDTPVLGEGRKVK